ncbi:uncharacterized protein LAJ45_00732 [Morchella importuna]|uniref:uncharacterized protein n=1 Tax=Morchella importuna TaxID=1174673 RepID=UPI001E8D9FF8|nr:uncharacterized protein LAJ45_00732 [Morchella importuna]KAH8155722.1 hypothetical protein LAJ45_00732 [Morchella importuna]
MADNTEESTKHFRDGTDVYTKLWKTTSEPVAHIFFLHGFSDHCNAYYTFPSFMASRGIELFSFDQRGWGRTSPLNSQYGHSGGTSQILADIDDLLSSRLAERPNIPCFLVGHSMGGGIALTYALQGSHKDKLAGTIVWSPMLELADKPLALAVYAGKFGARIMPNKQMVQKLPAEYMSRDKSVCDDFANDPLCHDTGTLIGISDMLTRGENLMKANFSAGFTPDKPILVLHGSGDKVTSHDASKKFTEDLLKIKDKTFSSYDGWYHKMHAEPGEDRITFATNVSDWILARATPGATSKL